MDWSVCKQWAAEATEQAATVLYLYSAVYVIIESYSCQFLMEIILVINWACACVRTSVEDDNFIMEGWGCVNLVIFIWEFLRFGLTQKALFQVILGLYWCMQIERKRVYV